MYEVEFKMKGQDPTGKMFNKEDEAVREAIVLFSATYFIHPDTEFNLTVWERDREGKINRMVVDLDHYVEG